MFKAVSRQKVSALLAQNILSAANFNFNLQD